jgi:hypothetical protein
VVCLCHCKHIGFVVSKLVNEWFVVSKLVNEWFVVCVIASDWKNGTMATSASHLDLVKNQGTMLKITYCCCNYDQYYLYAIIFARIMKIEIIISTRKMILVIATYNWTYLCTTLCQRNNARLRNHFNIFYFKNNSCCFQNATTFQWKH